MNYIRLFILLNILAVVQRTNAQLQRYLKLDSLSANFQVKKYTFNTQELYHINKNIEVYNVFINKAQILLFTVFPNMTGHETWSKIDINSIQKDISPIEEFRDNVRRFSMTDPPFAYNLLKNNLSSPYYSIIKKVGKDYYKPNICALQLFYILDYSSPLITVVGNKSIINIKDPVVPMGQIYKAYNQYFPKNPAPMYPHKYTGSLSNIIEFERNYLTQKIEIGGDTAYKFCLFSDWNVSDAPNAQRGIDRLLYIPGKGIVGGAYDYFFAFYRDADDIRARIPDFVFKVNIDQESIMLADELKK